MSFGEVSLGEVSFGEVSGHRNEHSDRELVCLPRIDPLCCVCLHNRLQSKFAASATLVELRCIYIVHDVHDSGM